MLSDSFWEQQGKDTMRYAVVTTLLVLLACGGCEKQKGPKTTELAPPVKSAEMLKPLEPPTAERSTEPTRLTDLAPPEEPTAGGAELARTDESAEPSPAARTYVVQKGDTLWRIATRLLGNGQRYRDIMAANPGIEPTKLQVGQRLTIPEK